MSIINRFPAGCGSSGGSSGGSGVKGGDVIVSHSVANGMTDHGVVTMKDGDYRLLEIKSSGTLTFDAEQIAQGISADVWLCNGGDNGTSTTASTTGGGGGKGGDSIRGGLFVVGALTAVVPGASGQCYVYDAQGQGIFPWTNNASIKGGMAGGAGGAGGSRSAGGAGGDGVYPYGDDVYFANQRHCGGGGGGSGSTLNYPGGAGGAHGGGGGGTSGHTSGYAGTIYGSGGGGGSGSTNGSRPYGAGYQGVIYIRIAA